MMATTVKENSPNILGTQRGPYLTEGTRRDLMLNDTLSDVY